MEAFIRGQARSAVRRSRTHREEVQRSKPEAMPPDECRSEGTPSLSEGPDAGARPLLPLGRLPKGVDRQVETMSGRYRRNGYVLSQQESGRLPGRHREQARSHRSPTTKRNPGQCAVTRCRNPELLGDNASANCVRLCIWVNRNTCDTYNFTVFSVIPNSQAIW